MLAPLIRKLDDAGVEIRSRIFPDLYLDFDREFLDREFRQICVLI